MEDIGTRLEAERPDVADALRSMNWEERLEEARARRKSVLAEKESVEKRPVVRVIDASVMARRKVDSEEPPPAEQILPPVAPVEPKPLAPDERRVAAPDVPATAVAQDRGLAPRVALGFGLGLGLSLGASVVAAVWLLLARPGVAPAPDGEVAAAEAATVLPAPPRPAGGPLPDAAAAAAGAPVARDAPAGPVAPDAPMEASAGSPQSIIAQGPARTTAGALPAPLQPTRAMIPEGAVQAASAPIVAAAIPARPGLGGVPVESGVTRPAASDVGPARAPATALPVATRTGSFRPPAALPVVEAAAITATLGAIPAEADAPLRPAPAPASVATGPAPAGIDQRAPEAPPSVAGRTAPSRPLAALAPPALSAARPGLGLPLVPVALPVPQSRGISAPTAVQPEPDARPRAALAPPTPPPAVPAIPGAESLAVWLAVPQTVPEAEAEEVAGLLREIGVRESEVTRVGFRVSSSHVRFYRPADAAAAAALGELIGAETRDMTAFRPLPPDGTLEIFLAGESTAPAVRAAAPNRVRQRAPDELTRMRDRIVNRLRRGEHL
jgi:hypothetical protein